MKFQNVRLFSSFVHFYGIPYRNFLLMFMYCFVKLILIFCVSKNSFKHIFLHSSDLHGKHSWGSFVCMRGPENLFSING